MLPGYKPYLNAVALKSVLVGVDIPSVYLGIAPFESLESIEGFQQFDQPAITVARSVDGSTIQEGSYFGLPGYGSLIPDQLDTSDTPYFGSPLGGV